VRAARDLLADPPGSHDASMEDPSESLSSR
jgi:hypothetical protein